MSKRSIQAKLSLDEIHVAHCRQPNKIELFYFCIQQDETFLLAFSTWPLIPLPVYDCGGFSLGHVGYGTWYGPSKNTKGPVLIQRWSFQVDGSHDKDTTVMRLSYPYNGDCLIFMRIWVQVKATRFLNGPNINGPIAPIPFRHLGRVQTCENNHVQTKFQLKQLKEREYKWAVSVCSVLVEAVLKTLPEGPEFWAILVGAISEWGRLELGHLGLGHLGMGPFWRHTHRATEHLCHFG